MALSEIDLNLYFKCPQCLSKNSLHAGAAGTFCTSCRSIFCTSEGIIPDLRAVNRSTKLDEIDYDVVYNTATKRALDIFRFASNVVHPFLDGHFPTVLELGAGTGGFSVGLAANLDYDQLILSDVSQKMLQVCRRKIEPIVRQRGKKVSYLCLDAEAPPLNDSCFDLVIAFGVVHHIFDFRTMFKSIASSLTRQGAFLCFEPNLRYHKLLAFVLGQIIERLAGTSLSSSTDFKTLLAWYHQSLLTQERYVGIPSLAQTLEDKHFFVRDRLASILREAGFSNVTIQPGEGTDSRFSTRAVIYLDELKIGEPLREILVSELRFADALFEELVHKEALSHADYYICTVETPMRLSAPPVRLTNPLLQERSYESDARVLLTVEKKQNVGNGKAKIVGWCIARFKIQELNVQMGNAKFSAVPLIRREDVGNAFSSNPSYPRVNLLTSGFEIEMDDPGDVSEIPITVVLESGQRVDVSARIPLHAETPNPTGRRASWKNVLSRIVYGPAAVT